MKTLLSVTALAVLSVGAFAQTKPAPTPKKIACAVMKQDQVDVAKATKSKMYADYKGRRYFFCCAGCPGAFKANPEKYKSAPSIPTPKPAKKK